MAQGPDPRGGRKPSPGEPGGGGSLSLVTTYKAEDLEMHTCLF